MHEQQTIQLFANTRDSFKRCPQTLAALMDLADGNLYPVGDQFTYNALVSRGLMLDWIDDFEIAEKLLSEQGAPYTLTDYGRAFVAWYRQPRDLPTQLDMFDNLESEPHP